MKRKRQKVCYMRQRKIYVQTSNPKKKENSFVMVKKKRNKMEMHDNTVGDVRKIKSIYHKFKLYPQK